ncbi:McrB family protein [Fusobacterium periodonticum]|uniref:McrB family protein n=1 Tax=Fusobacterium periodonticum TaxID=860 RepID=UPI00195EA8FD|nr:AAA family ATPase [Fusobacterium periodonticum]VTX88494.1 5-methylcytosine-specific restriction enzyme B [Fusobacterium periodonticum]
MTEVLDNNINQHFQELIIRTLGIITRNKTQKHIKITFNPLKELFKEYYKDDIWWKFQVKDSVPWLCFWSKKLAEEPARGIYPMFYFYSGKQNKEDLKYLILAFGKSVKKEPNIDWDKRLPLENINDFFNKLGIKDLPTYKNEINYGTSMVYKAYIVNQEKFNDTTFQNEVYNDFKNLFEYYLAYAKYITYEKNWSKISESKEELKIAYEKELNKILETLEKLNSEKINSMVDEKEENSIHIKKDFNFPLNTILYGPPGTGKTYNSVFYSVGIIEKNESIFKLKNDDKVFKKFKEYKDKNLIKFITFHQSYGYEDFIEGIRPHLKEESKDLKYILHSGIFKDMCKRAKNDKENNYVLVIDEINRGNISKIFGELISLIESSKREGEKEEMEVILPYSKEKFTIPKNLYIIGTMNTADRSIALLDIALRRRFNFMEIMPEYSILKEVEDVKVDLLLSSINEKIEFLLDREHTIGHSYFLNISTFEELVKVFKNSIIPLLQEYFYDDFEKIKTIFSNNGFIISKNISLNNQRKSIYKLNEEALKDKNNYKKIYLSVEDEE